MLTYKSEGEREEENGPGTSPTGGKGNPEVKDKTWKEQKSNATKMEQKKKTKLKGRIMDIITWGGSRKTRKSGLEGKKGSLGHQGGVWGGGEK